MSTNIPKSNLVLELLKQIRDGFKNTDPIKGLGKKN